MKKVFEITGSNDPYEVVLLRKRLQRHLMDKFRGRIIDDTLREDIKNELLQFVWVDFDEIYG